mmetsp:Transcript_4081/g.7821  ORF Transcript_4081/g.7821 Transcript_4081/m.7821 type:complete len:1385 (-) Transcript_4081:670-4824(-)
MMSLPPVASAAAPRRRRIVLPVVVGLLMALSLPQNVHSTTSASSASASSSPLSLSSSPADITNTITAVTTTTATAQDPDCSSSSSQSSSRYKALVCWLWKAKIKLPDEQFKEGLITLHVKDMTCTNFQVESMKSSSSTAGSGVGRNPSVHLELEGMSASCTGKFDGGRGSGLWGSVVASLGSSDRTSLHLEVNVASKPLREAEAASSPHDNSHNGAPGNKENKDGAASYGASSSSLPFPTSAQLSACTPHFLVHDVQFSGSASARFIGLFSSVITRKITSAMNENVCPSIKTKVESMLDQGLEAAREYIGGVIPGKSPSPSPSSSLVSLVEDVFEERDLAGNDDARGVSASTLDLGQITVGKKAKTQSGDNVVGWDRDMPFLKRILLGLNNLVSKHLNEGITLEYIQKLSTWQSSMTTADCEDCGFFFKGFNGLVSSLTKGAGSVEFPVPEMFLNFHHNHTIQIPNYGDITLTARKVKVSGLNKFTDLTLFRPEGKNLLSSSIASDAGFDFSVMVQLEVKPADGAIFQGGTLNEMFELHFNTSNVNFKSASAWELDHEMFHKLSVGSFIYGSYTMFDNNRNILNCVIEALRSVTIIDMHGRVTLDSMHVSPVDPANEAGGDVEEGLEDDVDALINNVVQSFLMAYPSTATEALAGLIEKPARKMLNDGLANLIDDTKKMPLHCVNVDIPNNKSEHPLRFDGTKALKFFDDVVNDERAVAAVNSFIGCVVNDVEAKHLLAGHFYNLSLGDFSVVLHDLHLENANSVYELELLKPEVDHYHLTNSLGYGTCAATNNGKGCATTSFSFGMNLVHSKQGNLGNVNVHINMKNLKLQGGTEIKLDMNYLPYLQIADLLSYPQCLSIPITNFDIYGLNSTVEMLEVEIDVNLNSQPAGPRSFKYQTEDSNELAHVVSTLMSKGSVFLEEALGDKFSMQLNEEAARVCKTPVNPHRSNATNRSIGAAGLWTFLFVSAFVVGNAWLFLRGFKKEEQEALLANENDENAEVQPDEQQNLSEPLLNNEDEMDEIFEVETPRRKFPLASSSSLMYDPSIHPVAKYGFPAVLILALILFLSSNISVGASVDLLVTRANGNNLTSLINIYEFSLGSTMSEMAQAGVYLLLVLILFCSGIWPYVKLVLMMVSWIASTRRLPPVKREKILYLLDSLGKFSLIDAYVLVLMMVAFRYNLSVDGVGELNVYVTPKYGFYSFLFATIISLVSGHCMLYLHRKTMLPSIPVYSGRYESLSKHIFDDKHGRGLVKLTRRFRRTIVFTLFLAFVLICVGIGLKSFHFKFSGVAGTALGDDKVRSFSLLSIGKHIPHSVQDSSSFGIHWIQTCYFFFAVVMPIICLLSMLVLFLIPMRLKQQQKVFVIAEIANAWSAIEVFVIAIV